MAASGGVVSPRVRLVASTDLQPASGFWTPDGFSFSSGCLMNVKKVKLQLRRNVRGRCNEGVKGDEDIALNSWI